MREGTEYQVKVPIILYNWKCTQIYDPLDCVDYTTIGVLWVVKEKTMYSR